MTDKPPIVRTLFGPVGHYCKDLARGTVTGWNRFWFGPRDPTGIACIRILVGLTLLWVHGTTCLYVLDYIGPDGWLDMRAIERMRDNFRSVPAPRYFGETEYLNEWFGTWSIYYHIQNPTWIMVTYAIFLAAIVCFTLGLFSRVAAVMVWAGHLSYVQRAWTIFYGLDTMLAIALLYLMIAPSGATLSLDRLFSRYRAGRRAAREGRPIAEPELQPSILANLATRLFQVHLCVIYACAGLAKLRGETWWNGYAIYIAIMTPELNPHDMGWMVSRDPAYDWVWQLISSTGIVLTLFTEIGFPFLVWNTKMRPFMLFMAMGMHFHIGIFMGLGTFQMTMIAMLLAFVSPATLRWIVEVLCRGPGGYRFLYDPGKPEQVRAATWIRAADPYKQVELVALDASAAPANGARLVAANGRTMQGYDAFRQVVRSLRSLWPIAWLTFIPGFAFLGRARFGNGADFASAGEKNGTERSGPVAAA